jgi:hypothetical protein
MGMVVQTALWKMRIARPKCPFFEEYAEIEQKTRSNPQAYSLLKEDLAAFTGNTAI